MIGRQAHAPLDGARRILIVDDVEDNRVLLDRQLKRVGFETTLAEDGMAALAEVSSNPPDLVLLDWMMPGLTGVETVRAMREHFDLHRLPIIMCTAKDEESAIVDALEAGANDYVQKPIRMPVLLARISAQLMRQEAMAALAGVNQDLEARLAERTRQLFASRVKQN